MSAVNITIVSQGGPVQLAYPAGSKKGSSTNIDLQVKVAVDPSDEVPKVLATLNLPPGHFTFSNGRRKITSLLGKLADGDEATISFSVNCDTDDPSDQMAMQAAVQDKFDQPTTPADLVYNVVKI
ncbi:hypothetical protein [Mucilaginibacter boryungensis]|uniref:Uncharacterized protein n=1 Tax=Mucilaginibacter boryungensis TaxID=768480 RepID=A0ABR9XK80_9SPHI|nr:hypothetical protein [Mucilaginibacter boryungensis]MBE9667640.1 hypothetical protein [Mucilaginibacter boryungensis]